MSGREIILITRKAIPILSTEKDAAEEGEQYYNSISFSGQVSGEAVSIYDDLPDRAATANSVNSALTEEQSVGTRRCTRMYIHLQYL